jgi:hypothetical protein
MRLHIYAKKNNTYTCTKIIKYMSYTELKSRDDIPLLLGGKKVKILSHFLRNAAEQCAVSKSVNMT